MKTKNYCRKVWKWVSNWTIGNNFQSEKNFQIFKCLDNISTMEDKQLGKEISFNCVLVLKRKMNKKSLIRNSIFREE